MAGRGKGKKRKIGFFRNIQDGRIVGRKKRMFDEDTGKLEPEWMPWKQPLPKVGPDGVVRDPAWYDQSPAEFYYEDSEEVLEDKEVEDPKPVPVKEYSPRILELVDACSRIGTENLTATGIPNTYALQKVSKVTDVTAHERDEAWRLFQERKSLVGV